MAFEVRINPTTSTWPKGIEAIEVVEGSYGANTTEPGKVTFDIEFSLNGNYQWTEYELNADGTIKKDDDGNPIVKEVHTGEGIAYTGGSIQIAKDQVKIKWKFDTLKDENGDEILDPATNAPYRYRVPDLESKYNGAIECVYTIAGDVDESGELKQYVGEAGLKELMAKHNISSSNPKAISVTARVVDNTGDPTKPQYTDQYEITSGGTSSFTLGQKMYTVTVTQNHEAAEYGEGVTGDIYTLTSESGTFQDEWCTVTLWKDGKEIGALKEVDVKTLDAGEYEIKFELIESAQNTYLLSEESVTFTVAQKELEVPEFAEQAVFNGTLQNIADLLKVGKKSYNEAYGDLIAEGILVLSGEFDARNAGGYEAVIKIESGNYVWKVSASAANKYVLAASEEELPKAEVDGSGKEASYEWEITPFVLTEEMLTKTKEGGIELGNLPEWVAGLMSGETPSLGYEQQVYESASSTSKINGEGFAFESGKDYFISLKLNGSDAENFVFAESKSTTSNKVAYKIESSGFGAAMTAALDFMKKNWLWLVIALCGLILLILLIVLIKKHKKNKAIREEKKRIEEEKRKIEEEKREEKERREQERLEEKERREQERKEEKERREEEERRRREEDERRRREDEERRRNTPLPVPMAMPQAQMQMGASMQPMQQAQAMPAPTQALTPAPAPTPAQTQPNSQPKQENKPRKKRPMPEDGTLRGFVPNGDGTYSPVNIRMKRKGMPDYPQAAMPPYPYPPMPQYPYGMPPMGYPQQGYTQPQYGMDNRPAEVRIAEEKARMLQEKMNSKMEADLRIAEERARANNGMSPEMMALLFTAMQNRASAPAYQPMQQPQAVPQPAQPIFITGPQPTQQPQPILITNQQPTQPNVPQQDGQHIVPPGAVMTTTSTTTIDASKRQNPATGYTGYEDDYDYNVYERLDDKNN